MTQVKIAYCSDIHLEHNELPLESFDFIDADVLVIAGDLMSFSVYDTPHVIKFFEKTEKYKNVVFVMGNHDYYGITIHNRLPVPKNWTLLQNETAIIEGIEFLGCTLWTDFGNNNPLSLISASTEMSDYEHIKNIDPYKILTEHQVSKHFLSEELRKEKTMPCVVVTHHCPLNECGEEYKHTLSDTWFTSNLSELFFKRKTPDLWIAGHNHHDFDFEINESRVLSNQRGYHFEPNFLNFKLKTVDIQTSRT